MNKIYTNFSRERRERLAAKRLVLGLSGPELTEDESRLLRQTPPAGIILFSRNLVDVPTLLRLVESIRQAADPAPTLWLDQEGGRVQRLRQPFTRYPSPLRFAWHERQNEAEAVELARLAGELNGLELKAVGIGVNCAPVLDLWEAGADPVIGERAFGHHPEQVVRLAGAWLAGFTRQGGLAMGKHFPGHGAATADSHHALPVVNHSLEHLLQRELAPFFALRDRLPAVMTAHLVATAVDASNPATCSAAWLHTWLRQKWDYRGLIVSDALEMKALSGTLAERAERSLVAGCDLLLCCTGRLADSEQVLAGVVQALESLSSEDILASEQRLEGVLAPLRWPTGDPWALLQNTEYQQKRARLEALAEETLSLDPTEWQVHP